MRRAVVIAAAVLALGGLATAARADEPTTTSGAWKGSTLIPGTDPFFEGCDANDVCGEFVRQAVLAGTPRITVSFGLEIVTTTEGCTLPTNPAPAGPFSSPARFNKPLTFECNGTYDLFAKGTTAGSEPHNLNRRLVVADPAPNVGAPVATVGSNRSVAVSWEPLQNPPKDFRGYLVVRSVGGTTALVATLSPAETGWTDTAVPAEGGAIAYAVRTRRAGAAPADGDVTSSGAAADPVEVAPASAGGGSGGGTGGSTGGGDTGGGGTGGGGGGRDGTGGGGSGGGGVGGTGGGGGGGGPSLSTQEFRVPRVGTPSRSFFPPLLSPPVDAGFEEELPFDDRELGTEEGALADEASEPFETAPGRGLAIPIATGLVLAVWALHLRYLARAGRPQYMAADDDLAEIIIY